MDDIDVRLACAGLAVQALEFVKEGTGLRKVAEVIYDFVSEGYAE